MKVLKVISISLADIIKRPPDSKMGAHDAWMITALPLNVTMQQVTSEGRVNIFYLDEEPDNPS